MIIPWLNPSLDVTTPLQPESFTMPLILVPSSLWEREWTVQLRKKGGGAHVKEWTGGYKYCVDRIFYFLLTLACIYEG